MEIVEEKKVVYDLTHIDLDKQVNLSEYYSCIQGEGKYMGVPHILIRFSGCRLRCQFASSFCDTPYASWKPEKMKVTYGEIDKFYKDNPQISHTMITGGGPTLQPELLKNICLIAKAHGHIVTIETEGSEFVETVADCISLSPKLSNSTPRPGTFNPFTNREVTEKEKEQHEKWRVNYDAMLKLITYHKDYQFKPVVSKFEDIAEIKQLQAQLGVPNNMVWLMPEGINDEQLKEKRIWLVDLAVKEGYNITDRYHVIVYGDKRGV